MPQINAYPLQWPVGWPRCADPKRSRFRKTTRDWRNQALTIAEARQRLDEQLYKIGVDTDGAVISSNLLLRLDGYPRSGQPEPSDCGIAAYWVGPAGMQCMAVDIYDRAADNIAAIAATLDAMRAIERHGGAQVLARAFTGFVALPAPTSWREVLNVPKNVHDLTLINASYKTARSVAHPDNGGTPEQFATIQEAWDQALKELA